MKHLLVDFDSTIPNLALMKISAWAKQKGDEVFLNETEIEPDIIWFSAIFTWNRDNAYTSMAMFHVRFPHAEIRYGGTCFDWGRLGNRIELPDEIENMLPDYSLYSDDRAVGYCQRGCNRKCGFCDVWKKEGRISDNPFMPLHSWVPGNFRKALLLDNDIALTDRKTHDSVFQEAHDMGVKLSLTQGYDIRTIGYGDDGIERAKFLYDNKPYNLNFTSHMLYFSWDMKQYEPMVRKGIERLLDAGFKGRELTCYVLAGFDHKAKKPRKYRADDDLYRVEVLWKEYGVLPYVMAYNNDKSDPMIRALVRWANKKEILKSIDFEDYDRNVEANYSRLVAGAAPFEVEK